MDSKILLIISVIIFLFFFALFPKNTYALTMYTVGHEIDTQLEATNLLVSSSVGGGVRGDCDYCLLPPWIGAPVCYLLCWLYGSPNITATACFDNQPLWLASYGGKTGVGYFNNTCDTGFPEYQHFGVWIRNYDGTTTFTTPSDRPMTMYAQVMVRVPSWTGFNGTIEPASLSFYDAGTSTFLPAVKNMTTGTGWQLLTIFHTFPPSSTFKVLLQAGEYRNMSSGWKMYFDYARVGYVDLQTMRDSDKNSTERMADCGWSTGTTGWGCSGSGTLWDEENNRSVTVSISSYKLGDDPNVNNDTFCQTWFVNHSNYPEIGTGTYIVRMPMEMYPFDFSSDTGEYIFSHAWGGIQAHWCYFLAKDYFYHYSRHYAWQFIPAYGVCSEEQYNQGWIDYLGVNEIRHSSLGHDYTGREPLSPWWRCGCDQSATATPPCPACTGGKDVAGGLAFAWNGSQTSSISMENITIESQNTSWVGAPTQYTTCSYENGGQKYFRHASPDSYMIEWNVSGDQWKISNWGVQGNNERFTMNDWLDGEFFFFGETEPDMYNVTCDAGWVCDAGDNEEYYLTDGCDKLLITDCGTCGCYGDRCRTGVAHWECYSPTEAWHYNSTCDNDAQVLCDINCTNVTGMCFGEVNCVDDSECIGADWCNVTTGVFYNGAYCNMTSYTCAFTETNCTYGCNYYGCLGIPTTPIFTNQTTSGIISEITGAILGFLSASGSGFFNILFMLFVVIFIISLFGLVAYAIKKAFD